MGCPFIMKGQINMIKKIEKEIQKLEQQKALKSEKINQLDVEISSLNSQLKELDNLRKQYEKLEQSTDKVLNKNAKEEINNGRI